MFPDYGIFTISIDFELYWGVRDKKSINQYKDHLQGVWNAIPEILRLFSENNIHATWAIVGFLYHNNVSDLKQNLPNNLPNYTNDKRSPYPYINNSDDLENRYHFAPNLIELIKKCEGQEIGTHTYSHYYCLENGQDIGDFRDDLSKAIEVAKIKNNIDIKSLVFPRNQCNQQYLPALRNLGLQCYRGNEMNWISKTGNVQSKLQRALRLVDSYINISGHNLHDLHDCIKETPYNFPASRFLRPHSNLLEFLEPFRLQRIQQSMTHGAVHKKIFHLWWHPHNFGTNTAKNIEFLENVIKHFSMLQTKFGMRSLSMAEMCNLSNFVTLDENKN